MNISAHVFICLVGALIHSIQLSKFNMIYIYRLNMTILSKVKQKSTLRRKLVSLKSSIVEVLRVVFGSIRC